MLVFPPLQLLCVLMLLLEVLIPDLLSVNKLNHMVLNSLKLRLRYKLFANKAKEIYIIITTALIPGKPAPKILPTYVVDDDAWFCYCLSCC